MTKKRKRNVFEQVQVHDKSDAASPYNLKEYVCDKPKKSSYLYAIKFNNFSSEHIFAVTVQSRIEIYQIEENKNTTMMRSYEGLKNEVFYTLDWSKNTEKMEMVLVAGGLLGKIYNLFEGKPFGSHVLKGTAINEIKFSPTIEYVFASVCENGMLFIWNLKSKVCIASFECGELGRKPQQMISCCYDHTGNYIVCGGMNMAITLFDLKRNELFQERLNASIDANPRNFCLELFNLHYGCMIKNVHKNYIDTIIWLGEYDFLSKSCDGEIAYWKIQFQKKDLIIFTASNIKIIKMYTFNIPDCDYWFIRLSIDPKAEQMAIGNVKGEVILWDLRKESFKDIQSCKITSNVCKSIIRQVSFSNDSKFIVYCDDDGGIFRYDFKDNANDNTETNSEVLVELKKSSNKEVEGEANQSIDEK